MLSRVAVGFHAPRTGLVFLFSLISQSPLKFHISCYEIWHTSGFFPPPSWAPLGFQLTACESQQPFRPASRSASCWKGWYPPHHSLLGAGCPFHPFCPFKMLLSLAALPSS